MEKIIINGLSYWYPERDKPALDNINLNISEGELVLIVGPSGSGKSTLLRCFNRIIPDFYGGKIKGKVYIDGIDLKLWNKSDIAKNMGMVYQHPEKQIVLQDVEREIAFGLENLNMDLNKMKRNVSEAISLLNLTSIKDKSTTEISGGEKQRIAIASVIAMNPEIIMFDEPISQLDPIGAEEVLNFIKKLNRDMGKTIILVEHRLDKCFDMADKIIFMENASIIGAERKNNIPNYINKKYFLPNLAYVFKEAGYKDIPFNVKEARGLLSKNKFRKVEYTIKKFNENVLEMNKLEFEYKRGEKTLKGINMNLARGEIIAVMGENGAGKSTLFKLVAGIIENFKGKILIKGKEVQKLTDKERIKTIGYLSQNPNDYLGRDTVFEEIGYTLKNINEYDIKSVENIISKLRIDNLRDKNPRDLSGGEKQRVAIACTMVTNPDILILDEPTRGMDAEAKDILGNMIQEFAENGKSVVVITHDTDFAADYSDNILLMFDGEIVARGSAQDILYDSIYYSSQIARVFSGKCNIVKSKDAIKILKVMQ